MQRTHGETATRQARIHLRQPEGQSGGLAAIPGFQAANFFAQCFNGGKRPHGTEYPSKKMMAVHPLFPYAQKRVKKRIESILVLGCHDRSTLGRKPLRTKQESPMLNVLLCRKILFR